MPIPADTPGKRGGKTRGSGFVTGLRKNLMQDAALQPAFQTGIGVLKPKRNAGILFAVCELRLGQRNAKSRYFCRVHAKRLERYRNLNQLQ